jgi:hypothetical protein
LLLASSSVLFSGCGSALNFGQPGDGAQPQQISAVSDRGVVHGGQAPITQATVSLYDVPAISSDTSACTTAGSCYGSALPAAIASTTTDANGNWSFSGKDVTCTTGDELFYIATGGYQIGNSTAASNAALEMTLTAGPCGNEFTGPFDINEVSTVVTEYALAGLSGSHAVDLSTDKGNLVGFTNAFATVPNLVNLSSETVNGTGGGDAWYPYGTPAYQTAPANTSPDTFRSIVPYDLINSLANVLAACVNENDSGNGSYCTNLLSLTGGATNTADAVLYIARHPGSNVSAILGLSAPQAPFGPTLTAIPDDLTMAVNYVGGGLGTTGSTSYGSGSTFLAIDLDGDIWVPVAGPYFNGSTGTAAEFSNQGRPMSPTTTLNTSTGTLVMQGGYSGGFSEPNQVAIDTNGDAWFADSINCLVAYSPAGSQMVGSPFASICPTTSPVGIALDGNNNIYLSGSGPNFIDSYTYTGSAVTERAGFPFESGALYRLSGFVGADYTGDIWYIDSGAGAVGDISNSGTAEQNSGEDFTSLTMNAAFDNVGGTLELLVPQGDSVEDVQPVETTGSINPLPSQYLPNSEEGSTGIAVDGGGNIYLSNFGGEGIPSNITVLTSSGSEISPSGTGYTGGTRLTALASPEQLVVDQSGNVWVVEESNANNSSSNKSFKNSNGTGYLTDGANGANLTEFIGLATPNNPVASVADEVGTASGPGAVGAFGVEP